MELSEVRGEGTTEGGRMNEPSSSCSPFMNALEIMGIQRLNQHSRSRKCVRVRDTEKPGLDTQQQQNRPQKNVCVPLLPVR